MDGMATEGDPEVDEADLADDLGHDEDLDVASRCAIVARARHIVPWRAEL